MSICGQSHRYSQTRTRLQCESCIISSTPSPDCLERGCATLRLDADTSQATSTPSLFFKLGAQIREQSRHQICNLLHILQYVYIPILLLWPIYYADQASNILGLANQCESGEGSTSVLTNPVTISPTAGQTAHANDNIELQAIVHNPSDNPTAALTTDTISNPSPHSPAPQLPSSVYAKDLEVAWVDYLDSRIIEWRISTTTACVFVAASPTLFQIPEASDDPITRSIAFLALCRALVGIIYGPICLIYFKRSQVRTVRYAYAWCMNAQESGIFLQWSSWILLSLPAISTCWAFIFYLIAIFSFIWRTGSIADPSPTSPDNPSYHPMAVPLALAIRIAITTVTIMDLGWIVWVWKILRGLDAAAAINEHTEAS